MKTTLHLSIITLALAVSNLSAATLYVSLGSTNPTPPYATWATAATSIQQATDAAAAGDRIRVTNGVYALGVTVNKLVALRSVNGPQFTVLDGHGAVGCATLTGGASLYGFTLRNGSNGGVNNGWVISDSTNAFLTNCVVTGNSQRGGNGADGFGGGAFGCTLCNCLLAGNWASYGGGGAAFCTLYNCTLAGNSAQGFGGGANNCTLYNCIVCFNSGYYSNAYSSTLNYCWTDADPLFVDYTNGNLRLQSNSPCINSGNNASVATGTDLDGRPRIVGGTVDLGDYEFQPGVSGAFIGWLQQYHLPTDGSADYLDSDGDGMNNWQEWICGTCPTNAASALRLISTARQGTSLIVNWQSVSGVNYFVERTANLRSSFEPLSTGIVGQAGTTSYADTNSADAGPFFYRVGVRAP